MNIFVVDTETSDLDPATGATILELAWIALDRVEDKWVPVSSYETYVQYNGPIHPSAQAQHHIRADKLTAERGALTRADAVGKLTQVLKPDAYVVAHNVDFDSKFLPEVTNKWICTYKAAKKVWPRAPGYSNQVLRYWLNVVPDLSIASTIKQRAPHQAMYDVATTTGILQKMLETYTIEELYKFSQPSILTTIEFGKYKGTPFNQIPKDYLVWLREQPKLSEDLKLTIDSILRP